MKNPELWNKTELHQHLQHALDLELWTIPLYLTALYSIKDLKQKKPHDYPDEAKLILSVVVPEMLHVELVCNISNALGYAPKFKVPHYDESKGIPFVHPKSDYLPEVLKGYFVKPQALNENSLRLFCAIELPHPKNEIEWKEEHGYNSISELYAALKLAIRKFWNEYYVGDSVNTKQKNTFREYHNHRGKNHGFSQIVDSLETALKAIEAIIEQGEGADAHHVPIDFRPPDPEASKEYDAGWFKGDLCHYHKFRILLHHHKKLPPVYAINPTLEIIPQQLELKNAMAEFFETLENNFNNNGAEMSNEFWHKMFALTKAIIAVWEMGCCPEFQMEDCKN